MLLDKNNIRVTGAASPVEPCDLFRNGNEFIHVKRYGGSSVLSHLFNQDLVSGEFFQMELEFRELLNTKLPDKHKLKDICSKPKTDGYHVVFAIISESDKDNLSIPFFSKISLKHVMTRLQSIGFVVTVAKISVNYIKNNKKICFKQIKNLTIVSTRTVLEITGSMMQEVYERVLVSNEFSCRKGTE